MRSGAMLLCVLVLACAKAAPPKSAVAAPSDGAGGAKDASAPNSASSGAAGDTLTRRQKDSVLGASRLPGARGIRGALNAQDSAAARNARVDSIQ